MTPRRTTAVAAATALVATTALASCSAGGGEPGSGGSDTAGTTHSAPAPSWSHGTPSATTYPIQPAPISGFRTAGYAVAKAQGWAVPQHPAQMVVTAGKVWVLVVDRSDPQSRMGVMSFDPAQPDTTTHVAKVPHNMSSRLTVVDQRPVLVQSSGSVDATVYTATTFVPSTGKALPSQRAPHTGVTWAPWSAAYLIPNTTGRMQVFHPQGNRWGASPKPSHDGAVIAAIGGDTPVEWVGAEHPDRAQQLYVDGQKIDIDLTPPKPGEWDMDSPPTITVRPIAQTDTYAVLLVLTHDDMVKGELVTVGAKDRKPLSTLSLGSFGTGSNLGFLPVANRDDSEQVYVKDGATAITTDAVIPESPCLTATQSGKLVKQQTGSGAAAVTAFDGTHVYVETSGSESHEVQACTVGKPFPDDPATPGSVPAAVTAEGDGVFRVDTGGQFDRLVLTHHTTDS